MTASEDSPAGITSRAARSGGAMFIAKSVRFGSIFIVNFILINLLVPADFGLIRYVLLVVGIANLLNEMGLSTAIIQNEQIKRASLFPLFCISTAWGALLYGILYTIAPAVAAYFATPELTLLLRVGSLMIPVSGITAVHRAWLRREMAYGKLAFIEMGAAVVSALVSVSMAFAGKGVWALVAGYLTFEGTISAVLLCTFRIQTGPLQKQNNLAPLLAFGLMIVGARSIDYVLCNVPFFLIGKVIGKEGLGLFSVAHDIAVFPQMAINAVLINVLLSTFSRIQTDTMRITTGFKRVLSAGALCTVPLLVIMACMPGEILNLICIVKHNRAWIEAAPLLRWLALMGIFYVFTTFSSAIWLAQGKIAASAGVSFLMFLTILIAIVIGMQHGLEGMACALFIRSVAVFPLFMYLNFRISGIPVKVFFMACLPSMVAGTIMAGGVILAGALAGGSSLTRDAIALALGGVTGITLYIGVLVLFFKKPVADVMELAGALVPAVKRFFP